MSGETFAEHKQTCGDPALIFTIGHSTRAIEEFLHMLRVNSVGLVVDVRTVPRSRHNPQFNSDRLSGCLAEHSVLYRHMPDLGGLRRPGNDSLNTGWKNASFRGFADYMQTPDFGKALDSLICLAGSGRTALMCAEAVPWRCHRSLIADALTVRNVRVVHILSVTRLQDHTLTPFARVEGDRILYPPEG
jgi:uncharacterized protein (DUF488 family)